MRNQITSMAANLLFTRSGVVWATWRLQGLPYGFGNHENKLLVKAHHQALFQAVLGESLILGLSADLDPAVLVERMMAGQDMTGKNELLTEIELSFEELQRIPVGERAYWLTVPLRPASPLARIRTQLNAVDANLREQIALPKKFAHHQEIIQALQAAKAVSEAIPAQFEATPAGAAEMIWIHQHMQQRGLGIDPAVSSPDTAAHTTREQDQTPHTLSSGSELPEPFLDEGGQSDIVDSKTSRFFAHKRRYLKVTHLGSDGETDSYQALMAMTGTPKGGFVFPGVEFISRLDQLPVEADFAIRMSTTPAAKVRQRNKRAENALEEQFGQQSAAASLIGGTNDLDDVARAIVDYDTSLNRSDSEVEVLATLIVAVGGATAEEAQEKARYIADDYRRREFTLSAPLGGQEDLWWSMHPGVPTSRLVRELAQITTGREFAYGIPLISNELGDPTGFRIADNISNGRRMPMMMDPSGNMEQDVSGSFAAVGELGGGKSVFLKTAASHVVDRGGLLFVIDRTAMHEYAVFAQSLVPENTVILDLVNPTHSLDPLRLFGAKEGARMTQTLLAVLLGIQANSNEGALLARIIKDSAVPTLPALVKHLDDGAGLGGQRADMAQMLSDRINVIGGTDLGAVLFDETLPPLPMSSQAIVLLTHGLELPKREELMNEALKQEMSVEKIFGRAMYALMAALGKKRCFADRSQMALFLVDEVAHMTGSPEGEGELVDFIRDGRKHKAACAIAGHDAKHDLGSEVLRGLIPMRFVFRCRDETIARNNVEWLGLKEERWIDEVTKELSPKGENGVPEHRRGECLVRDSLNRYGKAQILPPRNPLRRKAVLTSPPKTKEMQEA